MNFIVADDSVRQRDVLIRILRDEGHKVLKACDDGSQAVEECVRQQPDVVLLDVSMRHLNGDVAAYQIREKCPNTKIVVVSNMSQGSVSRSLLENGIGFVSKPYNTGQFMNRLREALDAAPSRD